MNQKNNRRFRKGTKPLLLPASMFSRSIIEKSILINGNDFPNLTPVHLCRRNTIKPASPTTMMMILKSDVMYSTAVFKGWAGKKHSLGGAD